MALVAPASSTTLELWRLEGLTRSSICRGCTRPLGAMEDLPAFADRETWGMGDEWFL